MLNVQQAQYIDGLRKSNPGLPQTELRTVLKTAGWPEHEIVEAISRFTESTPKLAPTFTHAPEANVVNKTTEKHGHGVLIVSILGLVLLGAGGAGAYFFLLNERPTGFPKLAEETILSHFITKLQSIETATYGLSTELRVVPREEGARAYDEMVTVSEEEKMRYKRDQDRFRDIEAINSALEKYEADPFNSSPQKPQVTSYPKTLSGITGIRLSDSLNSPYKYEVSNDKTSYTLTVTFETEEAARVARSSDYSYFETPPMDSAGGSDSDSKTVTIPNDAYISSYSFSGEPPKPQLFGLFDLSDIESFVPDNFSGSFKVGGSLDTRTDAPAEANLTLDGSVTFGDAQFALSAEGIKKGDTYYGTLHKIPALFSTLSQLRGKWMRVTEEDLKSYGLMESYAYFIPEDEDERTKEMELYKKQLMLILETASAEKLFTIVDGPRTDKDGETMLEAYELTTQSDVIASFYKSITTKLATYGDDSLLPYDEGTYEYLTSEEFKNSLEYVKENTRFTLWFNDFGYPVKAELSVRHIPSSQARALKESQIELVFTWTFRDINKKINIGAPDNAISFDELMMELSGKTKEEVLSERQHKNVRTLRYDLDTYREWSGEYPATLNDLMKKRSEVPRSTTNISTSFNTGDEYLELTFSSRMPEDLFTNKPFVYAKNGDNYTLTYEMKLSPYTKEKNPRNYYTYYRSSSSLGSTQYSMYDSSISSSILVPLYVNGSNIADKDYLSQAEKSSTDGDQDRLSNSLEQIFGTNPSSDDSDNDGFVDGQEILDGSDPLGPGRLEYEDSYGGGFF